MTQQHTSGIPQWRRGQPGVGTASQLLDLRDEADLAFVFEVIATSTLHRGSGDLLSRYKPKVGAPRSMVYLTGWSNYPSGLKALWAALRVEPPDGEPTLETTDGRRVNYVDVEKLGRANATKTLSEVSRDQATFVNGAEMLDEPVPDILFAYSRDPERKATKRRPYLCTVYIENYSVGTAGLFTRLSPKWWNMFPEYEIIRAARRGAAI